MVMRLPLYFAFLFTASCLKMNRDQALQPFQCNNKVDFKMILLNLQADAWKLQRFTDSACTESFAFNASGRAWPGVIVKDEPQLVQHAIDEGYFGGHSGVPDNGASLGGNGNGNGNLGAALAHISLFEEIAKGPPEDIFLIFEDNALFKSESLSGTCQALSEVKKLDFDYLNLRVLRPLGENIKPEIGLLRIWKKKFVEPTPGSRNVWMSSYALTGRGAAKILKCLQRNRLDWHKTIIDAGISQACLSGDKEIAAYSINHDRYWGHVETKGDSRNKYNHLEFQSNRKSSSLDVCKTSHVWTPVQGRSLQR